MSTATQDAVEDTPQTSAAQMAPETSEAVPENPVDPEEEKRRSHQSEAGGRAKTLAEQLYQEVTAERHGAIAGAEDGDESIIPSDIWTLDRMRSRKPLVGDLYGDGQFLFTFKPVLGTVYAQERYAIAQEYVDGDFASYVRAMNAYAEIVDFAVVEWPVRETWDDPKTGKPVLEDDPEHPGRKRVKTTPLPKTLDNVKRMDMDMLTDFLVAMRRAIEGEASSTP